MAGPKRDPRPAKESAQAFKVWLQAFDLCRDPLSAEDITRLYAEFCEADHREPSALNNLAGALKSLREVRWGKLVVGHKPDGTAIKLSRYTIKPGKYPKVKAPEADSGHPSKGGVVALFRRPLSEAPAVEPAQPSSQRSHTSDAFDHPILNAARAHWMRRDARHMNRKQRGSRMGRRAA
jgi:hypothetical protein